MCDDWMLRDLNLEPCTKTWEIIKYQSVGLGLFGHFGCIHMMIIKELV